MSYCSRSSSVLSTLNSRIRYHKQYLSFIRNCSRASAKLKRPGEVEIQFTNGKCMTLSSGKLARFADGACVGRIGETSVMVTAVSKAAASTSASFLPLTVDYRQKSAAAGRIPTNFLRRELGPSEKEILTSRMIDRSLRPLFPAGYFYDTQLICNLLAVDGVNDPDVISINAASAALAVSDIPWEQPVAAVRVGLLGDDHEVFINPTRREANLCKLDLIVAGTESKQIVMMEGFASEPVLMNYTLKAIKSATKELANIVKGIKLLQKSVGRSKREVAKFYVPTVELLATIRELISKRVEDIFKTFTHDKQSRDVQLQLVRIEALEQLKERYPDVEYTIMMEALNKVTRAIYADVVVATGRRCDGRTLSEIRPISCEVDLYKPLHGSAIFQRGQTQVLCSVAFDSLNSVLKSDAISVLTGGLKEKQFMLHYEFPPYATNEIGRVTSQGRRELGHGALAEKSLRPLVPDEFPFTIRLSCEVLESNGSSSMASVSAGSMALMDAGVPIKAPAAGIAIGLLITDDKDSSEPNYTVLTDILGMEDYLGEMDFKLAGTKNGFTSMQLDVKKAGGIPSKVVMEALQKGHEAKLVILSKMSEAISKTREDKKENWPVSQTLEVPPHKRTQFLGFAGQNIKKLTTETGVQVTRDADDVNTYTIFAPNQLAMDEANEFIDGILNRDTSEPKFDFGGIYSARIVEIRDNGVMVTLHPNMLPILLHLKELDQRKVAHTSALGLEVGQEFQVKYFGRDPVTGHVRISRRVLQMLNPRTRSFLVDSNASPGSEVELEQDKDHSSTTITSA